MPKCSTIHRNLIPPTFNMLSPVFKESYYDKESKSRKSGNHGTRTTPCAEVVLVKATKNHLLSTCSYKFSKSEIMTKNKNLGK